MEINVFKELVRAFQHFSLFSQKGRGKMSTKHSIDAFQLDEFLRIYQAFDTYCYVLADASSMKIERIGGAFKSMFGIQPDEIVGKRYNVVLKYHRTPDILKLIRAGTYYFDYLYKQEPHKRPYIKANYTIDLLASPQPIHVLVQSIPVVFNEAMEAIYYLNILTDISEIKTNRQFTHYILDTSDEHQIKKIKTPFDKGIFEETIPISSAEKRVLVLMAEGKSSKQIADELFLSEHTIKNHRKNMLKKLHCTSSAEMVKKGLMNGWI